MLDYKGFPNNYVNKNVAEAVIKIIKDYDKYNYQNNIVPLQNKINELENKIRLLEENLKK